jgi:hypothetical protein
MRGFLVGAVATVMSLSGDCWSPPATSPLGEARLRVASIELGHAVSPDKKVTAPSSFFQPAETVYASVVTEGKAAEATLKARWSLEGNVLDETTQRIAPAGTAVTEFHVYNPAGWRPGRYKVEISLDGAPVGERWFEVVSAS